MKGLSTITLLLLIVLCGRAGQTGSPTVRTAVLLKVAKHDWAGALRIVDAFHMASDRGLQSDPELLAAVMLTLIRSGDEARSRALVALQRGGLSAGSAFTLATFLASAGRFQNAIDLFERMPAAKRDEAFYFNLALAQSHLGHFEEARTNFFHAIDARPDYVEAYLHVGLDYAATGQQSFALPWLLRARELDSLRADIAYAVFDLMIALGYTDTVAKLLPEALSKSPHSALLETAQAQLALANADVAAAQSGFDRALRHEPDCVQALLGRANVALLQRDGQAARAYLERALRLDPLSPANAVLADLESSSGDSKSAIEHFRIACSMYCAEGVRSSYARVLMKGGAASAALDVLGKQGATEDVSAATHQLLARVYRNLARRSDAERENKVLHDLHQRTDEALPFVTSRTYIQ